MTAAMLFGAGCVLGVLLTLVARRARHPHLEGPPQWWAPHTPTGPSPWQAHVTRHPRDDEGPPT
jgi:hypothetical protein